MLHGVVLLATGIVLFLFGMMKLSEKTQQLFTARIRNYIKYAVRRPFYGLLTGIAATITLQSSSATTILVIGMVSAGLISFTHSLGILLGSGIGTTVTVQLVVWKITDLSPFFIIFGGILWLSGRTKWAFSGEAVFYFGLLFFGLSLAALATAPLRQNPAVIQFLQETKNPFLGLGFGIIFTGLIQASAIPISILVILAQQGLISLDNALPVLIGANIGTTVTALMAGAVSSSISGKRSALAHLLFKCSGGIIALAALPLFIKMLHLLPGTTAQQIAWAHFLFNLIIAVLFLFLINPLARLIEKKFPGQETILPLWPEYLDETCLVDEGSALECVHREMGREILTAQRMYGDLMELMREYNRGKRQNIHYVAWVVNNIGKEIVQYLRKISTYQLSPELSAKLFAYTGLIDDIARISDQVVITVDLLKDKMERHIDFSPSATKELEEIVKMVAENLAVSVELVASYDPEKAASVARLEEEIDAKVKTAREGHLVRYCEKICQAEAGPVFVEILIHLERISDHCQNIAEYASDLK